MPRVTNKPTDYYTRIRPRASGIKLTKSCVFLDLLKKRICNVENLLGTLKSVGESCTSIHYNVMYICSVKVASVDTLHLYYYISNLLSFYYLDLQFRPTI